MLLHFHKKSHNPDTHNRTHTLIRETDSIRRRRDIFRCTMFVPRKQVCEKLIKIGALLDLPCNQKKGGRHALSNAQIYVFN